MIKNSKFKTLNSSKGFSLIEIMVVIAILGILASVAVVNMGHNADRDMRLEADRFSSFLRDVQNKALASEKPSKTSAPSCYTGSEWTCGKICGFGIHAKPETDEKVSEVWLYYVVTSGDNKLNDDCSSSVVEKTYPGDDQKIANETFYFKNSVKAEAFKDVFFLSPNSEVYSDGSLLESQTDKTVGFSFSKDSATLNNAVSINDAGLIK